MKCFNQLTFFSLFCVLYKINIIFCTDSIYEQISPYVQDSKIVDPHSLYYNRQSKSIDIPKNYDDLHEEDNKIILRKTDNQPMYYKDSHYEVFARRLINMLIIKSNLKTNNGIFIGKLDLEVTSEELEIIKGFGEGKISIRKIDGIISNVIRSTQTNFFDEAISYIDIIRFYFYENRIIIGTILLTIIVIIIGLKVKWTRFRVIILIFDIMFIISYVMTWWELVQESAIKLAAQQKIYSISPSVCQQNEIPFSSSVMIFFGRYTGYGKDDCVQYFDAIMSDPVLKVTPIHALNHMCSKFLFYPISVAAYYLSQSIESYTGSLSWPMSFLIKVPLYLYMPIVFGILIFLLFGGSMGFQVGPFVHLYLHSKQPPPSNLLDRSDRKAIEVINSNTYKDVINSDITKTRKKSKHLKTLTNYEDIEREDSEKQVEIDDTSDEFPEEMEYEKISRRIFENEEKKTSSVKIVEKNYLEKENEQKLSETRKRNKKSLKIENEDY